MIIYAIFISALLRSVDAAEKSCDKEWQASGACYKKELETYLGDEGHWENHTRKISRCFNESKCEPPSYNRNPLSDMPSFMRKVGKKIKDEWANTSTAVKQCVQEKLRERVVDELVQCLSTKSVDNDTLSKFANASDNKDNPLVSMLTADGEGSNSSQNSTRNIKKAWLALVNVMYALRVCNETKGKNVEQCVKGEYGSVKKGYCKEANNCRSGKTNSSQSGCQTKGERVYQAICQCKQEKIRALVHHLDQVREVTNVSIFDLIEALSHGYNVSDYLTAVRTCYGQHNETVPKIVGVALTFSEYLVRQGRKNKTRGDSGDRKNSNSSKEDKSKSEFIIDKVTLNVIRDLLVSQYFDEEECTPCAG